MKIIFLQDDFPPDWWKPIAKKHGISYNSFTIHNTYVFLGEKTINDEIESYEDVVVIHHFKDHNDNELYRIYKSETASYDNKSKVLEFPDCRMDIYNLNSESIEPLHSVTNLYNRIDLNTGGSLMSGGKIIK